LLRRHTTSLTGERRRKQQADHSLRRQPR
jgi:hypothetical protein